MPKNGIISLRMTLATAFALVTIATSALIGSASFFAARSFIRDGTRQRLRNITALAAPGVDVDAVAKLRKPEDKNAPEYANIKRYLREVKQTSPDIRFVYLYRVEPSGKAYFVADNEPEGSKDISDLGDEYEEIADLARNQYTPKAGITVEDEFTKDRWGTYLSAYAPILNASGQIECALGVDMSAESIVNYESRFQERLTLLALLSTILVLIVSVWCSRRISQPLLKIAADLGRIERLELDHQIGVRSWVQEIILMRDAVAKLKSSLSSFRKYVPADLVADLMALGQEARLSAEKREVTVLFSDIANFSAISEKISPEKLVDELSVYFGGMTRSILEHDGTVDKYIGDSIMAFWGAPRALAAHAFKACQAALECRDHSLAVARQQQEEGKMPMLTRIGINSGTAIVGNIGYDARLNYTAMGDMVNLASRLEGLNKYYGTQILISEATLQLVGEAMTARFIDVVAVKGKSIPVRVYELICARGDLKAGQAAHIRDYERGMESYLNRQFPAAIELFEAVLAAHPDDHPASVMLQRSRAFLETPPPDEWKGEFIMEAK
jgi:class 3 adenylate cyclase